MLENNLEKLKQETIEELTNIDNQIAVYQARRRQTLASVRAFLVAAIRAGELEPHVALIKYLEIAGEMLEGFYEDGPLRDILFYSATENWARRTNVDIISHLTLRLFTAKGEKKHISLWCYPETFISEHSKPMDQIASYWNAIGPKDLMIELAIYLIENDIGYFHYDW